MYRASYLLILKRNCIIRIVRGISQVMANTHDGALDENGEPIKIGLKREEGVAITDKRVYGGVG